MDNKFRYDKYGRIVIQDEELLKEISGAIIYPINSTDENSGCSGSNSGCSNSNC